MRLWNDKHGPSALVKLIMLALVFTWVEPSRALVQIEPKVYSTSNWQLIKCIIRLHTVLTLARAYRCAFVHTSVCGFTHIAEHFSGFFQFLFLFSLMSLCLNERVFCTLRQPYFDPTIQETYSVLPYHGCVHIRTTDVIERGFCQSSRTEHSHCLSARLRWVIISKKVTFSLF